MNFSLDRIDFAILELLQENGRLTNKEIAAAVGLAPSSCFERVKRLTQDGAIRGFHAEVAAEALGIHLQAMVAIQLKQHSRELVEAFYDHVLTLPEVVAVYHVAGRQDFMVHVVVRDTDHLRNLAMDAFTTRPEVAHLETSLIYAATRKHGLPRLSWDS
ncbi:MAG: Lrp/AsnC family transcriptional regulator [bacterium]